MAKKAILYIYGAIYFVIGSFGLITLLLYLREEYDSLLYKIAMCSFLGFIGLAIREIYNGISKNEYNTKLEPGEKLHWWTTHLLYGLGIVALSCLYCLIFHNTFIDIKLPPFLFISGVLFIYFGLDIETARRALTGLSQKK